jgi:CHAT domain-containing protein
MRTRNPVDRSFVVLSGFLSILFAISRPGFCQPAADPHQLQKSGISRIEHWVDTTRRTGDASAVSELVEAQAELQTSFEVFMRSGDASNASLSAIKVGDVKRLRMQWQQAEPDYKTGLNLAQTAKRRDYQTKALTRLAYSELRTGETDAAAGHIREAVQLGSSCGNEDFYFEALDVAGEVEVARGNLVAAGEYLDRALALSGEINDKSQLYFAYEDRGDLYLERAKQCASDRAPTVCNQLLDLSEADYRKAVTLTANLGYTFMSGIIQQSLDDVKVQRQLQQKMPGSLPAIPAGMFEPKTPKDVLVTERFSPGQIDPATVAKVKGAYNTVKDFNAQMQQRGLAVQDQNPADYFALAQIALMSGSADEALKDYRQVIDLLEKDRRKLGDEQARSAFMEDKITYYYYPALLLLDRKQYAEAFSMFERARSRVMADLLESKPLALQSTKERTLLSQKELARTNIAALQEKLFNLTGSPDRDQRINDIVGLEQQLDARQREYSLLETRIAQEAPKLNELTNAEPVTLEKVQHAAADGKYEVLYYVVQNPNIVVWHIGPNAVQVKNVFLPQSELHKKTVALRNSLVARRDDPDSKFDEETSRQLFLYLVQPVLDSVSANHLIIVPAEELNSIPFQALENPATAKYLGEDFALSYAPSATVLASLKNGPALKSGRLLAVADPQIHDAVDEVTAIGKLYPNRSKVVSGSAASKADIQGWVHAYSVVHLSVHGRFNASDPLLSYLQLAETSAENGRLTAAEMFGLPLEQNSLVVLSACETGRVDATHANEVLGMVRSLLYAGAGSLILSSWEVNAASTKLWMETFYKEGQHESQSEAARRALIAVRAHPEYNHPFFWAPFVMTGK